jgi:transcriptional regulator with XRE-family HTH domain
MNTFGDFFKQKRIQLGKTLRQFCLDNDLDPGNISKIERGRMVPSTSEDKLREFATFLHIEIGSDEWQTFQDLAMASAGKIPEDLREDEIIEKLPIFFRTLRNKKFSNDELDKLIEKIKEA